MPDEHTCGSIQDMANTTAPKKRGQKVEPEVQAQILIMVRKLGPGEACRRLGISRSATLHLAVGAPVLAGTAALAREYLRNLGEG